MTQGEQMTPRNSRDAGGVTPKKKGWMRRPVHTGARLPVALAGSAAGNQPVGVAKRVAAAWALTAGLLFGCFPLPVHATTLFALVNTGEIYASTNQGTNWTILAVLPVRDAVGVAAGATSAQLYLATASGGFYSSSDAGSSWSGIGTVPANDVAGFLILPDVTLLLLTASGSVYRSTDQGVSFSGLASMTASNFVSLAQVPVTHNLYALTRSGDVFESLDEGSTWSDKGAFPVSDAVSLDGVGSALFALTGTGDVYLSQDGAADWQGIGTLSQVGVTALTHDGGTLLAGLGTGEVARSPDGINWTWQGTVNQMTVRSLGVDTPVSSGVGAGLGHPAFALDAPWPNPVRLGEDINLNLHLATGATVSLVLYGVGGRKVAERPAQVLPPGTTHVEWAPAAPTGSVYFVQMKAASGQVAGQRIVVVP